MRPRSGDIHVNLDSSTPCWNDAIKGFCLKLTEAPPARIFKEMRHREEEIEAFPSPPTQFSKESTKATKCRKRVKSTKETTSVVRV
jgi:hypothetical protein